MIYSDTASTGDRKEIAKVVNTLMQKEVEAEPHVRKPFEQDSTYSVYRISNFIEHDL